MPTVSDEFIIRLGLDPTSFRKGREVAEQEFKKAKESAVAASKSMEESNKKLADTFNVAKRELIGFYAALLGATGLKDFLQNINDTNAALGRFAQNIGATTGDITGWSAATERMGGTAENAQSSLNTISKMLYDLHTNGKALAPELYRLQGGLGKIAGTKFDTEHGVVPFMNDVAKQAQKLAAIDPQTAFRLLTGAGITDDVANTMIKYGAGMQAYVDSLQKGLAPSKEAIKAAQDLQASWAAAQQTVTSLGNEIAGPLDTALVSVLDPMTKWIADNKELITLDVKGWVKELSDGINSFASSSGLAQAVQFFKELKADADAIVATLNTIIKWENSTANPNGLFGPKAQQESHDAWDRGSDGQIKTKEGSGWLDHMFKSLGDYFSIGAHAGELQIQGSGISHGNPMPVDIVKSSGNSVDPDTLLGGPVGSGGPLSGIRGGGGTAPSGLRARGSGGGGFQNGKDLPPFSVAVSGVGSQLGKLEGLNENNPADLAKINGYMKEAGIPINAANTAWCAGWVNAQLAHEGIKGTNSLMANSFWSYGHREAAEMAKAGDIMVTRSGSHVGRYTGRSDHGAYEMYSGNSGGDGPGRRGVHRAWYSPGSVYFQGLPPPTLHSQPEHPHSGAHLSSLGAQHAATTSKSSNAFHIAHLNVDARGHQNADGISNEISASLERSTMTMMSQSGQV